VVGFFLRCAVAVVVYLGTVKAKEQARYRGTIIIIMLYIYQPLSFKGDPRETQDLRRRTEIIPVKDPHTRIKPLALASGHGRYITVTPERTPLSVGEWPLHIAVLNL
jgi:hypothetical protein